MRFIYIMDKTITINLRGGFGNQLFQIIGCLSLAKYSNHVCKYYSENIGDDKYKRKLEVSDICSILKISKNDSLVRGNEIFLDENDLLHPIYYSEHTPLKDIKSDINITGLFSNYRIHQKDIIKDIKKIFNAIPLNLKFIKNEYISIHVRELHGTGSKKIQKNIESLPFFFYENGITRIENLSEKNCPKTVVIFSDSWQNPDESSLVPKIKDFLNKKNYQVIDGDLLCNSELEIVAAMSNSYACIIGNSSMSWWGGYLNNNIVISPTFCLWEPLIKIPDSWIQIVTKDIYPKTHHKIKYFNLSIENDKNNNIQRQFTSKRLKRKNIIYFLNNNLTSYFSKLKQKLFKFGLIINFNNSTFT